MRASLIPLAALVLAACAPAAEEAEPHARPAADAPAVAADPADSTRRFALALHRELGREETGNIFFSPLSIATAFGPVTAGAGGETRAAIVRALSYPGSGASLHSALGELGRSLGREREHATLTVANALWVKHGFGVRPEFERIVRSDYGASVVQLDFAGNPDGSARAINAWVSERTNGRIPSLIEAESLDEYTRLVVTNAVYFLADWQSEFRPGATAPRPFTLADGSTIRTPMMSQRSAFRHHDAGGFAAIDLPYRDPGLAMTVLLPAAHDGLPALEQALNPQRLADVLRALDAAEPVQVDLQLPKLELRTSYEMEPALTRLGMGIAFSNRADFSGISQAEPLAIDRVIHKTFLRVDEKGTEAAAATGIEIGVVSMPAPPQIVFHADRPFLFMLRDRESGAILFFGRIMRPEV